jgi:hypothetical protein
MNLKTHTDFIETTLNEMFKTTDKDERLKKLEHRRQNPDYTSDSDSDSEEQTPLLRNVMLGTYDVSMERHNDIINEFNYKYRINEQGSNGSRGHYFTNGDKLHDLNKIPHLKRFYEKGTTKKKIKGVYVHIHIYKKDEDDSDSEEEQETPPPTQQELEQHERRAMLNNVVKSQERGRVIPLMNYDIYLKYCNLDYIKVNTHYNLKITDHTYNFDVGDIIYKQGNINQERNIYEVVRITKKRLYIRQLRPQLVIQYDDQDDRHNNKKLFKVVKGEYGTGAISYTPIKNYLNKFVINDFMFVQR